MDQLVSLSGAVSVQVDRFGAALGRAGVADERIDIHRATYQQASAELLAYQRTVAEVYRELRVGLGTRLRLQSLANRTYRLARRYKGEKLYQSLAESVQDRLIEGSTWVEILAVVDAGMRALELPFNLPEAAMLRRMVTEGRVTETDGRSSHESTKDTKAERMGTRELRMTNDDFRMSNGRKKGTAAGAKRARIAGAVKDVVANDTSWEAERQRLAMKNLKLALAGHHKIVKEVVARRLCEHRSFDELAAMLDISREDVAAILDSMRKWVCRFTAYFSDEWYWKDGGKKFILPRH